MEFLWLLQNAITDFIVKGNDLINNFFSIFICITLRNVQDNCLTIAGYGFFFWRGYHHVAILWFFFLVFVFYLFLCLLCNLLVLPNQIITIIIIIFLSMTWQQLCTSTIPYELMKIIIIRSSIQQLTVLRALLASCCYISVVLYLFLRVVNVCVSMFLLHRYIRHDTISNWLRNSVGTRKLSRTTR